MKIIYFANFQNQKSKRVKIVDPIHVFDFF